MSDTINIKGLDKAAVLCALFNGTRQVGAGAIFHPEGAKPMALDEAKTYLHLGDDMTRRFGRQPSLHFDYLLGRPIKVDLSQDEIDISLYDRDHGQGAALKALRPLLYAQ